VSTAVPELLLYHRFGCHLCETVRERLTALAGPLGFRFLVVDVDAEPRLASRYGDQVPVVEAEGRELCRYHLDEPALRAWLKGAAVRTPGQD
jgi:hypothetical protein